jgi:hypothetical protein
LPIIFILTITLITPSVSALSGSWTRDFAIASGKSSYTLLLESPDEVTSNSNWTITTTLRIDHMDTFKTFVFFSSMIITIETENGDQMKKDIQFGHFPIGEFPDRLYPGSRWGPNDITFDLSEEDIDIPFGGSTIAGIFITVNIAEFLYQPFRAEQLPETTYETFALNAGSVKLSDEGNLITEYFIYILGLAVGASIFLGLIIWTRLSQRGK